jgi:hypothetical protein
MRSEKQKNELSPSTQKIQEKIIKKHEGKSIMKEKYIVTQPQGHSQN